MRLNFDKLSGNGDVKNNTLENGLKRRGRVEVVGGGGGGWGGVERKSERRNESGKNEEKKSEESLASASSGPKTKETHSKTGTFHPLGRKPPSSDLLRLKAEQRKTCITRQTLPPSQS